MQIRFDQGQDQYYAIDMSSKHGVFINGVKIDDEAALLFTLEDFADRENALSHFKKVGERKHPTISIIDDETKTEDSQ